MIKKKIGIIDLKINNIHSIYQACIEAGYNVKIISENQKNYDYNIVILPGIGSYKKAMKKINEMNFKDKIENFLIKKNNLLFGICLGMQLFFSKSFEFGLTNGLNFIEGSVQQFNKKNILVPHTRWNEVILKKKIKIFNKTLNKKMFYFTHSYFCVPNNKNNIICETIYGDKKFCSVVEKENIFGTQFHPEKSGLTGVNFLKKLNNF